MVTSTPCPLLQFSFLVHTTSYGNQLPLTTCIYSILINFYIFNNRQRISTSNQCSTFNMTSPWGIVGWTRTRKIQQWNSHLKCRDLPTPNVCIMEDMMVWLLPLRFCQKYTTNTSKEKEPHAKVPPPKKTCDKRTRKL